jgi:hypothetical protein
MGVVFTFNQLCQVWSWCPVLQRLSPSPSSGVDVMVVVFACNQLCQVPSVAETLSVSITRGQCDECCVRVQ